MNKDQMSELVRQVSLRFAESSGYPVTARARGALVAPSLRHLEQVSVELEQGRVTMLQLEAAVLAVLKNALPDVQRRDLRSIDASAVESSMARYCPYLFWC